MNNKVLGSDFEKRVCAMLSERGYWVHFITPDNRGAQPFDIIAVKDNTALAIECKTLSIKTKTFSLSRLEDNQIYAFNKWVGCGNPSPQIWVEHGSDIKVIDYEPIMPEQKDYISYKVDDLRGIEV